MRIKSSIRPLFIKIIAALDPNENVADDEDGGVCDDDVCSV